MKKTVILFAVAGLVLASVILWAFTSDMSVETPEVFMIAGVVIIVGFALFFGWQRLNSLRAKEPVEDELSKQILVKSSSLSYYISIYLWLFIMYMSDKTTLESHALIGLGIMGMAMVFFLSWLFIKLRGLRNG